MRRPGDIRNRAAQTIHGIRRGPTGLAVPTVDHAIFGALIQSVSAGVEDLGFTILPASYGSRVIDPSILNREYALTRKMLEHRVDGIALVGLKQAQDTCDLIAQQRMPALLLWTHGHDAPLPCVGADSSPRRDDQRWHPASGFARLGRRLDKGSLHRVFSLTAPFYAVPLCLLLGPVMHGPCDPDTPQGASMHLIANDKAKSPAPADALAHSRKRARRNDFDASATVSCAQNRGAPHVACTARVAREDGATATVVVTFANGFARHLYFEGGVFVAANPTMSGTGRDVAWHLSDGTYVIRVDDQRYRLPDTLIDGP